MFFTCEMKNKKEKEIWEGEIANITDYGSHHEFFIKTQLSIFQLKTANFIENNPIFLIKSTSKSHSFVENSIRSDLNIIYDSQR
ncbi:hypothetical protein RBH29_09775 [Herbivorax sp. ANBcel31]|uniref:hypothetical protein n=1 Tax=Herbivorax sp. ANBcel31 TaxID=3069754 RepID=UPI0027B0DDDA|nr:hypothetical protein [Herbivorax sp. ANBcel31]MDQ2086713.1 hypothetical protein [Herbivorax sp. ANBcel31]